MASSSCIYDVIVIGYGPGGEVLASTLGAAGLKVLVAERWPQPYPLPRLTTLDGEVVRVVQATSVNIDKAFESTLDQQACHFVDAAGEPVLSVPYPGKLGGWASRISMFQPDFEQAIADKVDSMPNVEIMRGWEASELWQEEDAVHVTLSPSGRKSGETPVSPQTFRAKYLVGTDGARSFIRMMLGVGMKDYDMHQRWLNFDAEHLRPIPERLMALRIFMDPERPHMYMPIGKRGLRMEFRVMEGETDEEVVKPEVAWDFMRRKYDVGPEDFRLMRQVVYHYRTRVAESWRVGRVFLAGDAAHLMPPYMGQGACAAIRDTRNLGWKLVEVLTGRSSADLLDTYQTERVPHLETILVASDKLSRMVNITDPAEAEARNVSMRERGVAQPPELPSLTAGVLLRTASGQVEAPAGRFTPQGRLERGGVQARGDDLLGGGFQLWCRRDPAADLGEAEAAWLRKIGCEIGVFDEAKSVNACIDLEGVYLGYLNDSNVDCVLVRPDFYAFGGCKSGDLNGMVRSLADQLLSTI